MQIFMKLKQLLKGFLSFLKSIFLQGFFTLLPITATIFIMHFSYVLLAKWLTPLRSIEPQLLQKIPGSEFVLVMLFIFFIGVILKLFLLHPILHFFEGLIIRIPLVRTIYSAAKKLVEFFNVPEEIAKNRQVVLIEYPKAHYYNIAFLLGSARMDFQVLLQENGHAEEEEYVRVFMPNSPNPSSGYFFVMPKSKVVYTTITFEEAIKTIVSCGLIIPESLKAPGTSDDPPQIHTE